MNHEKLAPDTDVLSTIDALTIPEILRLSKVLIASGRHSDAVKVVNEGYLLYLSALPMDAANDDLAAWPPLGVQVHRSVDGQIKAHYSKQTFTKSEALTYVHHLQRCIQSELAKKFKRNTRKLNTASKISQWLPKLRTGVGPLIGMVLNKSALHLSSKQKYQLAAWLKKFERILLFRTKPVAEKRVHQELSRIIHEPANHIATLITKWAAFRAYRDMERVQFLHDAADNRARYFPFAWVNEQAFGDWLGEDYPAKILTTIHMGLPVNGAFSVSKHTSRAKRIISLVQFEQSESTAATIIQAYRQVGLEYREYGRPQFDSLAAVSELRKNTADLFLYFDLSASHGESVNVTFFGRKASFAMGAAKIAITARTPIYTYVTFYHQGRMHLEMHEPIDPRLLPSETLESGVQRITQRLVDIAESYIRRFPEQWQFFPNLPAFFQLSESGSGAETGSN